jgi:hypothetical protein
MTSRRARAARLWRHRWAGLVTALLACACANGEAKTADDADPCGPKEDVHYAGRTAGTAAKTGAETAWEGVKTVGESVGGFFSGGSGEAKNEWKEGQGQTRDTAREGGSQTKETAKSHPCH